MNYRIAEISYDSPEFIICISNAGNLVSKDVRMRSDTVPEIRGRMSFEVQGTDPHLAWEAYSAVGGPGKASSE